MNVQAHTPYRTGQLIPPYLRFPTQKEGNFFTFGISGGKLLARVWGSGGNGRTVYFGRRVGGKSNCAQTGGARALWTLPNISTAVDTIATAGISTFSRQPTGSRSYQPQPPVSLQMQRQPRQCCFATQLLDTFRDTWTHDSALVNPQSQCHTFL